LKGEPTAVIHLAANTGSDRKTQFQYSFS